MELSIEFRVKEVQLYIGAYVVCFVCTYVCILCIPTYVRTCTYVNVSRDSVCTMHMCLLSSLPTPTPSFSWLMGLRCDLASDSGQFVIVKLLEPKMVFVVSGCVECCV